MVNYTVTHKEILTTERLDLLWIVNHFHVLTNVLCGFCFGKSDFSDFRKIFVNIKDLLGTQQFNLFSSKVTVTNLSFMETLYVCY